MEEEKFYLQSPGRGDPEIPRYPISHTTSVLVNNSSTEAPATNYMHMRECERHTGAHVTTCDRFKLTCYRQSIKPPPPPPPPQRSARTGLDDLGRVGIVALQSRVRLTRRGRPPKA